MDQDQKEKVIIIDDGRVTADMLTRITQSLPDVEVQLISEEPPLLRSSIPTDILTDESHFMRPSFSVLLNDLINDASDSDTFVARPFIDPQDKRPGHLKGLGGHISGMRRGRR